MPADIRMTISEITIRNSSTTAANAWLSGNVAYGHSEDIVLPTPVHTHVVETGPNGEDRRETTRFSLPDFTFNIKNLVGNPNTIGPGDINMTVYMYYTDGTVQKHDVIATLYQAPFQGWTPETANYARAVTMYPSRIVDGGMSADKVYDDTAKPVHDGTDGAEAWCDTKKGEWITRKRDAGAKNVDHTYAKEVASKVRTA